MGKKTKYREVQYIVGMSADRITGEAEFFPMVSIDGQDAVRSGAGGVWVAPINDSREQSLSFGAAQSVCDRYNADLQARGLNRLREVS